MARLLIEHGRVVDPAQGVDRVASLLIEDGRVVGLDEPRNLSSRGDEERIDAAGKIVCPGLIDLCVELREPGLEEDETIESGARAALAGGFTTIAASPATEPPIDTAAGVQFVRQMVDRADQCRVVVLGCVSRNREGQQLAEIGSLAEAGVVGLSDGDRPIRNAGLLRAALAYCRMFDKPIFVHPELPELTGAGVMHQGLTSMVLGLSGMPAEAEDVATGRDARLAEATGGRLHLLNISSAGSVDLLRRMKSRGVGVTAGIAAVHFALTDESLRAFDANLKLNPPLRSADHVEACIAGLADGTLDVIFSLHAPRAAEKKMVGLDQAPFGGVGLETTLALTITKLVAPGRLTWSQAIEKLSANPARILGLTDRGTLAPGSLADVTLIDPAVRWTVEPRRFRSKSDNSPLAGVELQGRAVCTLVGGRVRYAG